MKKNCYNGGVLGYDHMERDGFDAPNVTATAVTAIAGEHEHKTVSQEGQVIRQLEAETEKSQTEINGALRPTSGNAAKRLKMRQDTYMTTRAGKTAEAAAKQMAA